ncbi:MAG: 30S ribosome-binding factor RbfA [Alphaproteobacteria bacterium]|jgi:ribosome-binding factor A|tara:strand:+ start:276 stop:674 length:399 start_codon:yes stop_codon:yes gene_type:complete
MKKKHSSQQKEVSQRQLRVQELLRSALNEILIRGESKNPILDNILITITYVDVSPDLRNAKFYIVPSDTNKIEIIIESFNESKKIIRKKIADKVKLKYVPEISFFFDETINEIKRLDELFSSQKVQDDTIIK